MTKGDRIRLFRENKGITLTELADRISVSKQTLYKYEMGIITNIPSDKIELIADCVGVSPAKITGWIDKSSITVTAAERDILEKYRRLDTADKGRIHERLDTLLESEKYKKEPSAMAM